MSSPRDCPTMHQARQTARLGSEFVRSLRRLRLVMRSCQSCPLRLEAAETVPGSGPGSGQDWQSGVCGNLEKVREQIELAIQQAADSNQYFWR